jgi:hypothetical protein
VVVRGRRRRRRTFFMASAKVAADGVSCEIWSERR